MQYLLNSRRILGVFLVALVAVTTLCHGYAVGAVSLVAAGLVAETMSARPLTYLRAYTGVTLAELFIPTIYADIQPNDSPETTAFAQSGVAVTNPLLQKAAESGTKKIEIPLWNDLDASVAPNLSDDTDTVATPGKIDTTSFAARNAYLNKGYGAADLATEIAKATAGAGDPMTRIKNRFGSYWAKQFQYRIIAMLRGIKADNDANDSGDMTYNIAAESTGAQSAATKISADAVVEACFTLGDKFNSLAAIAMHSVPYKTLVKQQLIEFVKDADGKILYEAYLGKRLVVDDGLPVIAGTTSGLKYVTMLFGGGAVGYGEGTPAVPAEVERKASSGSGGGLENIWERKTWLLHVFGFDWLEGSVAGESATLAELRLAANWNRVVARKNTPIAFLQTNA